MIVACTSCQTRFRVADDKVGPRGARVRCTRCGVVFTASPPPVPTVGTPSPIAASTPLPGAGAPHMEGSETTGWPTGALEQARRSEPDSPSSPGRPLPDDPFAAFASPQLALEERTSAAPLPPAPPSTHWSLGTAAPPGPPGPPPDGLREVEIGGATDVDGFEVIAPDPTGGLRAASQSREALLAAVPEPAREPTPTAGRGGVEPPAASQGPAAPSDPVARPRSPGRSRALVMNVLSLAALLVVTLGIVVAWRGGGLAGLLPGRGAGPAGISATPRASGVYEGAGGFRIAFVQGDVLAGRGPVDGRVAVRVVFERGGVRFGAVDSLAGAAPGPVELSAVGSAEQLETLRRSVAARAVGRLAAGESAPFLAAIPLPAGGEDDLRFRIESVGAAGR